MNNRKKLHFMLALQLKTTDPELAERNAQNVIDNIKTQEELDFVKSLLDERRKLEKG